MKLHEVFLDPPAEFRQAPFWFWNHRLDPQWLSWQIRQMHEQGVGGFVMHARHGLITPYLSDEWFECIRHCCAEAKVLGMMAWAYDERDWPSGPAGGEAIADPAHRLNYLRLEEETLCGPLETPLPEDVVAAYTDGRRVEGRTLRLDGRKHRVAKAVRFECPAILWFESYLDTLSREACQAFIRSTYDRYEARLGDLQELGLAGFFTDEPALSTYPDDLTRIPWTPALPEAFRSSKGYDLLDRVPDLFSAGEAGAQVRYDYWDVATDLFEAAFFKAIADWCGSRGLQLIGHPLGEEPLFFQFRCLGTIFKYLRHQHMPGMDHLTITVGKHTPLSMTPKIVVSAALLAGRARTMTETFGESGWGLTLREMKWMADWQMVHGINYFLPHGFYYSVSGRRKKDSPPSEFYQAPYWPYYRIFADYTARVTAAMTGGEHGAKIAVLYPMASVWADFVPGPEIPESVMAVERGFAPLGEALLSIHRDFVVVDEDSLARAEVGDGVFTVNGLTFEALVLPFMTRIPCETLDAVRAIAQTATVVAVGAGQVGVLNLADTKPVRLADIEGVAPISSADAAVLAEALRGVPPEVSFDGAPEVYYLHRRKEGKDLYFFANTGHEPVETVVSIEGVGAVEAWDAETGERTPAPGQAEQEGRMMVPLELAPAGSRLFVVAPGTSVPACPARPFQAQARINVCEGFWHFTPFNGNFLALRDWHMSARMRHKVSELSYSTEFILTEDVANLRLLLDGVPEHPVGVPEAARPLVRHETYNTVRLDGEALTEERPWEIDCQFRVLDLRGRCAAGTHRLEILIRSQGWFPQPGLEEYAWLVGDFMADLSEPVPRLSAVRGVKCGPWEDQGFPFFSGTAAYAADVMLPAELPGKRLFLDAGRVGSLLEVEVNGQPAGVRAWPPYRVDITPYVWPGEANMVVLKVTNSLRNLFEGPDREHPSGLLDSVWLEIG